VDQRHRLQLTALEKGKDERNIGYIKHHFFVRYRAFESWAHLNQLAEQWLREEADPRVHGTVHEVGSHSKGNTSILRTS
jgi:transposase